MLLVSTFGVARWDPLYAPPELGDIEVSPRAGDQTLRVLSINMAHGRGTAFHQALTRESHIRKNLESIAQLIRAVDADVVALQELDAPSVWSGGFDHLAFLASQLGGAFPHRYHGLHVNRSTPRLAYGTGVLSRFPIRDTANHAFGLNTFDTKGFVYTRIAAPGGELALVSLHLDFKRDSERAQQLRRVSSFLEDQHTGPLVIAGDFNCAPDSDVVQTFAKRHRLRGPRRELLTFPARRPLRSLDHVFVTGGLRVTVRESYDVRVSDHLPVLAELVRE